MKSVNRAIKTRVLSIAAIGLLAGAVGAASASEIGSTDIYRNEFPAAFASATTKSLPGVNEKAWSASTDIYANKFRQSFGDEARTPLEATHAGAAEGSTDVWGRDGFERSFGSAAS